jgi:hypothetical protein
MSVTTAEETTKKSKEVVIELIERVLQYEEDNHGEAPPLAVFETLLYNSNRVEELIRYMDIYNEYMSKHSTYSNHAGNSVVSVYKNLVDYNNEIQIFEGDIIFGDTNDAMVIKLIYGDGSNLEMLVGTRPNYIFEFNN